MKKKTEKDKVTDASFEFKKLQFGQCEELCVSKNRQV